MCCKNASPIGERWHHLSTWEINLSDRESALVRKKTYLFPSINSLHQLHVSWHGVEKRAYSRITCGSHIEMGFFFKVTLK